LTPPSPLFCFEKHTLKIKGLEGLNLGNSLDVNFIINIKIVTNFNLSHGHQPGGAVCTGGLVHFSCLELVRKALKTLELLSALTFLKQGTPMEFN
jgi:hypothetical protein